MNDILLINGPIKKFVRQLCKCRNSLCVGKTEFGEARRTEDDRYIMTITEKIDVCNKCGTSYAVQIDTSNITLIKNIGD